MKRLRKEISPLKVRFFGCGEYGEQLGRPHYHLCLFGWRPFDLKRFAGRPEAPLYRSAVLERLWPFGFVTVGDVTFESAAYVARYITKKVNGDLAKDHYQGLKPEFITMSRRPGIATDWFNKYSSSTFPRDQVVLRGRGIFRPPKFYDRLLDRISPSMLSFLKAERKAAGSSNPDNSGSRLIVREAVKVAQTRNLRRRYER